MNKRKNITAFYLETILMMLIFVCVILILTKVFGYARLQSVEARRLTTAVLLAENAAEAALAADSEEDLAGILSGKEQNAMVLDAGDSAGQIVTAAFDEMLAPSEDGPYRVEVTWDPVGARFVKNRITVRYGSDETPVYTLETGSCKPEPAEPASVADAAEGPIVGGVSAGGGKEA